MTYRYIITLDVPDGECPELDAAFVHLDNADLIVREQGFPLETMARFAIVRWFRRRVADFRCFMRETIQGESDAMRALRLLKKDLAAVEEAKRE